MRGKLSTTFLYVAVFLFAICSTAAATTTWYVNGVTGSDGNNCLSSTSACRTIGHAISLAASGDAIRVAAALYTENLSIGKSLRIVGSGAPKTIIDGGGTGRVATISAGIAVSLSGLTIRNGLGLVTGGGILNSGVLRLVVSAVTGNRAYNICGAGCSASGGGISNSTGATLTITRSTVSGNTALVPCNPILHHCWSFGGGILNQGRLVVNSSTISGNAAIFGGGIDGGTVSMYSSTVAANTANTIANANLSVQNSILENCSNVVITSNGYNLSKYGTCNLSGPGDMNNTDPMLGPLQFNGGPTQTMALPSGSPALDAGNPSGCTDAAGHLLKTDQRGKPRPDLEDSGIGCDIGAYESQSD